jgi:hypothetical protein
MQQSQTTTCNHVCEHDSSAAASVMDVSTLRMTRRVQDHATGIPAREAMDENNSLLAVVVDEPKA